MLATSCTLFGTAFLFYRASRPRKRIKTVTQSHTSTRTLGHSSVQVTVLGMGGASIGDLYVKIPTEQATSTLLTAVNNNINYFDTSPWYGVGLSEARFGAALLSVPRRSFILQTKVGRFLIPDRECRNGTKVGWIGGMHMGIRFDYSAAGFQRQMEDSLQRMGLGYLDSVVIHDLEPTPRLGTQEEKTKKAFKDLEVLEDSGWNYLVEQRAAGHIGSFGAGLNSDEQDEDPALKREWNKMYVQRLVHLHSRSGRNSTIDFLLLANMFSLLNFEALEDGILTLCSEHGISVVVGGPYSSGILATGPDPKNGSIPFYNYGSASDEIRERCRRVEAVCLEYQVPLIAAAIQFPLLHPAVVSVIPGGKNSWEVLSNVTSMNVVIPLEMWHKLQSLGLIPSELKLPPM